MLATSFRRRLCPGLLLAWACAAVAQDPAGAPPTEDIDPPAETVAAEEVAPGVDAGLVTHLVFEAPPRAGSWLEIAHLALDAEPFVAVFDEDDGLVPAPIDPGLPQGPAMLCAGRRVAVEPAPDEPPTVEPSLDEASAREPPADEPSPAAEVPADTAPRELGIACRRIFLYRGEASFGPPDGDSLELSPPWPTSDTPGTPLTGGYRLGVEPIEGARVALVPFDLRAEQGFVLPLGRADGDAPQLRHAVDTDADGRFRLPPVQAGRYFLEAILPSGRVHRSEPIDLPDLRTLRTDFGPEPPVDLAFDLGTIDVAAGLVVEIAVVDDLGRPVEGARVHARQGDTPATLATYAARTDAEGRAVLSGFDVERPARLGCVAPGHVATDVEVELIPVVWTCTLARLARVAGQVVGPTDELPAGVGVSASLVDTPGARPFTARVGANGAFILDLAPGTWELVAAAPGLVPQRLTLFLAAGDVDDLGVLPLLPGRELLLRVVDADTREPVVEAAVRAVDPPGAVDTVTDVDGEARVVVPDDRPMLLAITAEADGYSAASLRVDPDDREPRTVALQRGGWIRVRGCPGCRLRIVPGDHRLVTDGDGNALSSALAPRWYDVVRSRFEHLGSTVVETPDAERRRVRVRPGRVATVDFERLDGTLAVRPDGRLVGTWRLEARTPWSVDRAVPEADGSWRLVHPPRRRLDRWLYLQGWDAAANAEIRVYQTTLPADFEGEAFTLPIGTGQIRGRLQTGGIGFSGEPASGVRVRLLRFEDGFLAAEVHSDPEGRFHVPHLPVGTYALHLGDRTYQFLSVGRGQTVDAGTFQLFAAQP